MPTSSTTWPRRVAILGVGLLGGSVGLALRRRFPNLDVIGTSRDAARRDAAVRRGAVGRSCESISAACADCDVVVVASPVDRVAAMAIQAAAASPDHCLITDVGSTKAGIVQAVSQHPLASAKFVAAHPIAGSEKSGVEYADPSLFDNRVIVLTPTPLTDEHQLARAQQFWQATGGRTLLMTPADHDAHLAAVSHLPHLVSSLVARLAPTDALPLIGSGWKDITRVAAGDPTMWAAICAENRSAIASELKRFVGAVTELQNLIEGDDQAALHRWLEAAKQIKDSTTTQPESS